VWYIVQRATDSDGTGAETFLITQGSMFVNHDMDYTHFRVAAAVLKGGAIARGGWSSWIEGAFGYGTTLIPLTNKSGADVSQGDVVVIDKDNAMSFETTTTPSVSDNVVCVASDAISDNIAGLVAVLGYVARINTNTVSTPSVPSEPSVGSWFKTSGRAGNADVTNTLSEGVFGMSLGDGHNPPGILFGLPVWS
jgi:hypothetical protein